METEILVVGGGPTGALAAERAARRGCNVSVFDQRLTIGAPDHCAGLLSISGLEKIGLKKIPEHIIQNSKINGAIFHSPSGKEFKVSRNETQAMVVSRELFDQYLLSRAEERGAAVFKGKKITRLSYDPGSKRLQAEFVEVKQRRKRESKSIEAFLGIIAEGRGARLTKEQGFKIVPKKYHLPAMQFLVENVKDIDLESVEMFLSNKVAPGFFAWIIPTSYSSAKVGLASREGLVAPRLRYFLRSFPPSKDRFKTARIIKKYGGEILVDGLMKKTSSDGILVIGDAAGQTKATTGGGVITGGLAGIIAGEAASEAIEMNDNSKRFLVKYDHEWRKRLEFQLRIMAFSRRIINRLTDKALEQIFDSIIKNRLEKILEAKGDIDRQAEVILTLVRNPAVIKLGLKLLPNIKIKL